MNVPAEPALHAVNCPNCNAVVPARAILCPSCGVNIPDLEAALPELRHLQAAHDEAHRSRLDAADAGALQAATRASEAALRRWLMWLAAATVIVLLLVGLWGTGRWLHNQALIRRADAAIATAEACLQEADYVCARDALLAAQETGVPRPDVPPLLRETRLALAQQYAGAGQWELAAAELDAVLTAAPGNAVALDLLRDVYDRWIQDAAARGDVFLAFRLRLQRDARFGDE